MIHADDASQVFNRLRPRLQDIACGMLGSTEEAEEVVHGAWLRWREAAHHVLTDAEAWLASVTTRLAVRRLQAPTACDGLCDDAWVPPPLFGDLAESPDQIPENVENVSLAFLTLLDQLTPTARAAFLMRELFGADFREVAVTLGISEPACRQLVHCARFELLEMHARFSIGRNAHFRLLRGYAAATERGDLALLRKLLAKDAELVGYDSHKVPSVGRTLRGGGRIARLCFAVRRRYGNLLHTRLAPINGEWALLQFIDGILESAQSIETDGARIVRIHVQRHPEKLARLASALNRRQ